MTIVLSIKKVLEFKRLTDKILLDCFNNKDDFKASQKEGFDGFLNQEVSPDASAHYLAILIDKLMMKENPNSKSK